ncbi:hypothetical protein [Sphingomonas bacterium]|uniref:hypothetical protein n=1 Tax=Sphingomonas bacterium TaxID=1895847 RepID=UPI001575F6F6|nr:hypothetical protein [Sphingomonas bacterium]
MEADDAIAVKKKRRSKPRTKWTPAKTAAFFDHLSIAGNISQAAAAVGMAPCSVHRMRARDAEFADAWEVTIEAGYATIEMRLIGHTLAGLGRGDPMEAVGDAVAIDVDQALRLLKERDTRRTGARLRSGARPRRATAAETDALILAKLAAIAARKTGA